VRKDSALQRNDDRRTSPGQPGGGRPGSAYDLFITRRAFKSARWCTAPTSPAVTDLSSPAERLEALPAQLKQQTCRAIDANAWAA